MIALREADTIDLAFFTTVARVTAADFFFAGLAGLPAFVDFEDFAFVGFVLPALLRNGAAERFIDLDFFGAGFDDLELDLDLDDDFFAAGRLEDLLAPRFVADLAMRPPFWEPHSNDRAVERGRWNLRRIGTSGIVSFRGA